MKKTIKCVLGIVILVAMVFALNGCATTISKDMIVDPDPDNPFQGTWIDTTEKYLMVINGMNGTWYTLPPSGSSAKPFIVTVYTIEETDDGFVTNYLYIKNISVNGNVLLVDGVQYERYLK